MLCMYVVLLELYTTIKKTKYSSIYFVNTINWWCWPWPPLLSSSIVIFITDYCSFCSTKLCLNKSINNSCSIGNILFVCLLLKCCISCIFKDTTVSIFQKFSVWLHVLPEKQHSIISGRTACVCVSVGEIKQVNLLRLQRALLFILLSQVTKRELTVPALLLEKLCFSVNSKELFLWVRLVQEDITLRQAVLLNSERG